MTRIGRRRLSHIDLLKLVAANLIVLHHLAAYGPIADVLTTSVPGLISWLYDYARMAVQVFLVIGGYLAARGLSPHGQRYAESPLWLIAQRYRRLVLPYLAALGLAVLAALLARHWMHTDWIPAAPTAGQVLAHIVLLQGLLGVDSLSAGVWYVAIDFQLFALLTLLHALGNRSANRAAAPRLVLLMVLASLFYFNRDEQWDNWALYFFGAYGLGALVYWSTQLTHPAIRLAGLALVVIIALAVDFRERIALAVATALLLGMADWRGIPIPALPPGLSAGLSHLGQRSYSLFLVHFPVCVLGNVLFFKLEITTTAAATVAFAGCWLASLIAAHLFFRWVESPLNRR